MAKQNPQRRRSSTQELIQNSEKDRVPISKNIYYKKSQQKYYVVFYCGVDPETRKPVKWTKTYASEKEAVAARNAFDREKQAAPVLVPKKSTLFTYIDDYIRAKEVAGREKATLAEYHKFEKHLHEYGKFESTPVQSIAARDIVDYLHYLDTDKGLAANTRRKHYDFLKSLLSKAVYDRMIPTNPVAYIDPPKKTPSCAKAMPESLASEVLARAAGTKVEPIIILLGFGMRREEVAGLRWEHVDLKKGLIYVREVRTEVNGAEEIKRPKTKSSERTIAIPARYLPVFVNIKQKQRERNQPIRNMNHLYVVGKEDGTPYSPNYINDLIKKFEKENNLSHYRLHDYRHTSATLLYDAGVDIKEISKLLGHSSVSITADLYTHPSDTTNAKATNKLSEILSAGKLPPSDS